MNLLMPGGSSETLLDAGHFDFILDEFIGTNNNHHHHHQCHLCPQRFNTKLEFKSHLKHHGQQKQFQCQHCCSSNKSKQTADNSVGKHSSYYLTSTKLWSHMSRSHFKTTECFYCSLCDNKPFKQAFNYHLHMLIHTGEQPHVCPTCSKAFRTKPSLRKHELIHTGHKPYHCSECNSRFKTKDELKQHGISHTTGKPWRCHYCSMKFKYQASLKRHEKKGRCKIGKHWCPTQLRRKKCKISNISSKENLTENLTEKNSKQSSEAGAAISRINEEDDISSSDNADEINQNSMLMMQHKHCVPSEQQHALFRDVFLGGSATCVLFNSTTPTTPTSFSMSNLSSTINSNAVITEPLFSF